MSMADMMILQIMAESIGEFAESGFLNIASGCCGTTPEHIAAIADAVADKAPNGIRPDAVLYSFRPRATAL